MLKILLITLCGLSVVACRNQKQSGTISSKDGSEIVGQLPMGDVNPDQALVQIIVLAYSNGKVEGKVVKLESMGHGFKDVVTAGQKVTLTAKNDLEITEKDSLLCVIQKSPEGGYSLVNYTKN